MSYDDITILEKIERGFLSDTAEGKAQIRAAKVRNFFSDYERWRDSSSDDPGDLPDVEHQLGITEQEWREHITRRDAEAIQF